MKNGLFYNSPLAGFLPTLIDEGHADFNYYCFQNTIGEIILMQEDVINTVYLYTYHDAKSDLAIVWANRADDNYQYPIDAFASLKE